MKKTLLLFTFLALCSCAFAERYSITVQLTDGYDGSPATNVSVRVFKGWKLLGIQRTNEQGEAEFKEIWPKNVSILIGNGSQYLPLDTIKWFTKHKTDQLIKRTLVPSFGREKSILLQEDSIYGSDKIPLNDQFSRVYREKELSYPGGVRAAHDYIRKHIDYPEDSYDKGVGGETYVHFVVEPDGKISHIRFDRSISPDIDAEIRRVLRSMPKWKPAKVNGKPIRARCGLPFVFEVFD